jgi:histidinol phosphatase-like enzyme
MYNKKIIAFDLDDTLCTRPSDKEILGIEKYHYCEPIKEMIDLSNSLYDKGHTIYIYTARGMHTLNGDVGEIYAKLYDITLDSLKKWGVKHNGLYMGKMHYDLLIDDKAMGLDEANIKLKSLL